LRRKTGEHRGLLDRMMRFLGDIDDAGQKILRQTVAARSDQGREVGQRAAGSQNPSGRRRVSDELAEPSDDVGLDLRQSGCGDEDSDVAVCRVRDEIGDRRVGESASRNVSEVAGTGRVEALRNDDVEKKIEKLRVRRPFSGGWFSERPRELGAALRVCRRLARQALDVAEDALLRSVDGGRQSLTGALQTAVFVHARVSYGKRAHARRLLDSAGQGGREWLASERES